MSRSQNCLGTVGDYELLEVLNDRPKWPVYKARRMASGVQGIPRGQLVSLQKLANRGGEIDSAQFRLQAEALRNMNHAHIPRHLDAFIWQAGSTTQEAHCLVLEAFEGEPMTSLLARNRSGLGWPQAKELFCQILQALEYAGQCGVVHGNLTLSSLYVAPNGAPKLLDFGIVSKRVDRATPTARDLSATDCFDYLAPDFARLQTNFAADEQSDIFSLAACLFHSITGNLPFPALGGNPAADYFNRWLGSLPPELEFRHPTFRILKHTRSWLARAMAPDREKRFKTFSEALEDFERVGYKRLRRGDDVYEFLEWLGKDRIGEMFRAQRLSDGRQLVVKRLFNDSHSARFAREAKILRGSAHPNLVEYVDFIEVRLRQDERDLYLVHEFLEGLPETSLRQAIHNSESGLDPVVVLRLFLGYLACLEHLHQRGIIHRDIKPANLYVAPKDPDHGKVFDLGIAYDQDVSRTGGQVLGTLDYMPPEFAAQSSGCGSPQSDIYSLGVTFYQALTSKLPFPPLPEKETEAWLAFFRRAQNPRECPFEHAIFKDHPELIPVVRQALAPDPKQRHSSAKAMRDALQVILEGWHRSQNKAGFEPAGAQARRALNPGDSARTEPQVRRPLEASPDNTAPARAPLPAQEVAQRRQLLDASVSAARNALRQENYDEAEKQARIVLELSPHDANALQLVSEVREGRLKQKLYDVTMTAARLALRHENYEEAERQANRAQELRAGDPEPESLLSQVRAGRRNKRPGEPSVAPINAAPAKSAEQPERQDKAAQVSRPAVQPAKMPVSPAKEPQLKSSPPSPNREAPPGFNGCEVIASWGDAKLIKYPGGKLELSGGSKNDRLAAKEWISMYFHEAVVKEIL
jgi:serine/threonine protein kinase